MAKATMRLEGFEKLQKAIREAPDLVKEHAIDTVEKTTFITAARMRGTVPVRTGRLKNAIRPIARGLNGRVVIDGVPYWRHVEYGTEKWGGKAYIRPSAELEAPHYLDRMRGYEGKLDRLWSA